MVGCCVTAIDAENGFCRISAKKKTSEDVFFFELGRGNLNSDCNLLILNNIRGFVFLLEYFLEYQLIASRVQMTVIPITLSPQNIFTCWFSAYRIGGFHS
jgi:hypothetical protein